MTNDKELKGKLINILKNAKKEENIKIMEENVNLYHQTYIDKDSVFTRNSKNEKRQGKPLEMEKIQIEYEEDLKEFIKKVGKSYTSEKVKKYMEKILGEKQIVKTTDISINTDEDFILLMLGTMSEEKSFYNIEYKNNMIQKGKYKIPEMIIRRR